MEGNWHQVTPPPPPSRELPRSDSDASPLDAGDWTDDLMRDDIQAWNDEKHNSYIRRLETSFVKQLHQSKCQLAQCSEQPKGYVNNASEQFNVLWNGCWQKINCVKGEPLPSRISGGTLTGKGVYDISHSGKYCSPPSLDMTEFLKLCHKMDHGEPHALTIFSDEFPPNKPTHDDVLDLTREGTGQNFSDEGDQMPSDFECHAKRLKI